MGCVKLLILVGFSVSVSRLGRCYSNDAATAVGDDADNDGKRSPTSSPTTSHQRNTGRAAHTQLMQYTNSAAWYVEGAHLLIGGPLELWIRDSCGLCSPTASLVTCPTCRELGERGDEMQSTLRCYYYLLLRHGYFVN